jgi:Transposase DDE domain
VERHFALRRQVAALRERRQRPQITLSTVWLSAFGMFALRLPSFNALEDALRYGRGWARWGGSARLPSADTVGRVLAGVTLPDQRALVRDLAQRAWRAKSIHGPRGETYRVVAVDGHELWASRARCCAECLSREVSVGTEKLTEYYHRVVVAQWVGVTPPAVLDVERIRPGEGEVVAARRLLSRVLASAGRLIDVITADALYLEGPFIEAVLAAGKHVVVGLKQHARDLYRDAERLRELQRPRVTVAGPRTTRCWDLPELQSFPTVHQPVRVVWAEEQTVRHRRAGGILREAVDTNTWIWVTDLPPAAVPATKIQQWGHARWDVENRGFNELSTLWHMDHCFVHQPTAIEVLLLVLSAAFLLTYLFYTRNLKPGSQRPATRVALAARFRDDVAQLPAGALWPVLQRSD